MKGSTSPRPMAPNPAHLLLVVLSVIAGTSLQGAVTGWLLVPLALAGAAVAATTFLAARSYRLHSTEWFAISIGIFLFLGGLVAGPAPTPSSYRLFFRGLVEGWADLLSSVPPVELVGEYRVLPYALAWLGGMVGFALYRHVPIPAFGALGPFGAFALGLLFSVESRNMALVQGTLLGVLTVALGLYQAQELGLEADDELGNTTVMRRRKRLYGASAILLVAAAGAPLAAPLAPGFDDSDRYDLRDTLVPPWEPLNEPSPLAQIKGNYLDDSKDMVAFVVKGESIPRRWNLATLASFDGTVWTVGDADLGGSAPFVPIDGKTPLLGAQSNLLGSTPITVDIEVVTLEGPWLPLPGAATSIEVAADLGLGAVRFNAYTSTAALPTGFRPGLKYSVEAVPRSELGDESLNDAVLGASTSLGDQQGSGSVRNKASDVTEGVDTGWPRVAAIRDYLRDSGFYTIGPEANPGHSWGRLELFWSEDTALRGYEEQYAATAALWAKEAGLPARVVVGYLLTDEQLDLEEVAVTNLQASAWIEVSTIDYGWIPVDVTPDRDKEPSVEDAGKRFEDVAAPNPPPPPPPPPAVEIDQDDKEEDEDEEDEEVIEDGGLPTVALVALGGVGFPLSTLGLWAGVVGGLKARRRGRRKKGEAKKRIAGAWYETQDRFVEAGHTFDRTASPFDTVREYATIAPNSLSLLGLAATVDRAAFGPETPLENEADGAWRESDGAIDELKKGASLSQRCRRVIDPRPLLRKDPVR